MICRVKGYNLQVVMPENVSKERISILESFGAEIIFSEGEKGTNGAIDLAKKIVENDPKLFMPFQYGNSANPQAHYETTGPEIWDQTKGKITHLVSGIGTSGTIMGAGKFLKNKNPNIKLIGVQPDNSLHGLEGLKHIPTSIRPGIYNEKGNDTTFWANTDKSYEIMERLVNLAGMFVGHSVGAVVLSALEELKKNQNALIVCIVPDGGYRYLSGGVWW